MAGFGMGGSVATSSGVGQRAESEARQSEDRYKQEAEAIPTGMGAVPGIAQAAAPTLGAVVQESNNMSSSDTLGQVLQEASQTGLLSESESKLIGGQIGTPEGNEKARMMLGKTLPMRRADQKAIEFINSRMGPSIAEIKQTTDEGERQVKINKLVQDLQLQAAESEDEVTRTAIMKRVEDMFGIKGGNNGTDAFALENLRFQNRTKLNEQMGGIYEGLDEAKKQSKIDLRQKVYDSSDAFKKAKKEYSQVNDAGSALSSLNKEFEEYVNDEGEYELIGFSKEYFGELAKYTKSAANKDDQTPEMRLALKQQGQFITFLNGYMSAISGAAVTRTEAMRVLSAFGLQSYSSDLAPGEAETMSPDDFVGKLLKQNLSPMTSETVVNGLESLGNVLREKQNRTYELYEPSIAPSEFYTGQLNQVRENLVIPKFKNSSRKYATDKVPGVQTSVDATRNVVGDAYDTSKAYIEGLINAKDKRPNPNPAPKPIPKPNPNTNVNVEEVIAPNDSTMSNKEIAGIKWGEID